MQQRAHRGYVLIVTLAVLTLAATSLVAVGRAAVDRAAEARAAQDELQRRWGAASAQQAILPFAEPIVQQLEAQQKRAIPVLRATVQLGRQRVTLVLADEQAKANVNAMFEHLGGPRTEDRLRETLTGARLSVKLRPEPIPQAVRQRATTGPAGAGASTGTSTVGGAVAAPRLSGGADAVARPGASAPAGVGGVAATQAAVAGPPPANDRPISGFGQIFGGPTGESVSPARLALPVQGYQLAAMADSITCWGNGAINIRRANAAALRLATSLTSADAGRLIDARDAWLRGQALPTSNTPPPGATRSGNTAARAGNTSVIARLLAAAHVTARRPEDPMPAAFVDASNCHSLWVITDDGRREWFEFFVLDTTDASHPHLDASAW